MTGDADRKDFAALLAHIPVDGSAKSELSAMMAQLDRFYHGKAHLAQLWRRHRRFAAAEGLSAPGIETLIACAIAYHDCVYDGRRHDNEERSAETWMRASADTSLSEEDRRWVAETILATRDHLGYRGSENGAGASHDENAAAASVRQRARIWVLDLDLTPLGGKAAAFERDTASLRREARHLTDEEWEARRLSFLRRLAATPRIFRSSTLAAIFEAPARANLLRQLNRSRAGDEGDS
jgi:predicted metal-dependent HD superfamily phosphohydrolase